MRVADRVSDGWNGLLGRIRHPDASTVTAASATGFDHLRGRKHCLIVSFRRSGDPVPTPVWFGLDEGRVYFRSERRAAKVRRIRANGRVLVAPCNNRGKPTGPAAVGSARILDGPEEQHAERAIQANFGLGRKAYETVAMNLGPHGVYVEVAPG